MDRQLTVEKRGDLYHLSFHNYMGPWEGHAIEAKLRLTEVEAPERSDDYEKVLHANESYLWHPMDRGPDLHALVTADRLPIVAEIVRYRNVNVLAGAEHLPEMPHVDHADEDSYIEYIEALHVPVWERGPRAVATTVIAWAVPVVILALALVVWSRHMGDPYHEAGLDEIYARAESPIVQQSFLADLWSPDESHLLSHEIRTVRYCSGNRMLLGDGNYLELEGVGDAMPLLQEAQSSRAALVLRTEAGDGRVLAREIACGGKVLHRDVVVNRVAKLAESDLQPSRSESPDDERSFWIVGAIPWQRGEEETLRGWQGRKLSVEGRLVEEDGRPVLRTEGGAGVELEVIRVAQPLKDFITVFTGDPGPIRVDFTLDEVFPWSSRQEGQTTREATRIVGRGRVFSASAQNHHVIGRS